MSEACNCDGYTEASPVSVAQPPADLGAPLPGDKLPDLSLFGPSEARPTTFGLDGGTKLRPILRKSEERFTEDGTIKFPKGMVVLARTPQFRFRGLNWLALRIGADL